jgi:hypothetical protein
MFQSKLVVANKTTRRVEFLGQVPPNKKVEDMTDFNSFNLGKDGVSFSVKPWCGELEPFAELEEVWI